MKRKLREKLESFAANVYIETKGEVYKPNLIVPHRELLKAQYKDYDMGSEDITESEENQA